MKETSRAVLAFLQKHAEGNDLEGKVIAEALGFSGPVVTGSVNGLVKKGFAYREEVINTVTTDKGEKEVKTKYIRLTDEGMAFDPDAEVEAEVDAE